jgi:5-methylcytosine-specific restriction endonuclease McrA
MEDTIMRPTDEEVFEKNNFQCVYCGFDGRDFKHWAYLQVDHFIPKSYDGKEDITNLVTSCIICNQMKGAQRFKTVEEGKLEIGTYWDRMRSYWEENVKHRANKI